MLGNRRINKNRLRVGPFDHVGFLLVEEGLVEPEAAPVLGGELGVGFGYAHQLHVAVFGQRGKEAFHMAVRQAHNGHANGRLGGGLWAAKPGQSAERRNQAAVTEKQRRTESGHWIVSCSGILRGWAG